MNSKNTVLKKKNEELPVPIEWRQVFIDVVEAFKNGDFQLDDKIKFVNKVSALNAERMAANVTDYGDQLISLSDQTWNFSIYLWMDSYWQVLVDLVTLNEGVSDLVMFVKVRENAGKYCFTIEDIHVP